MLTARAVSGKVAMRVDMQVVDQQFGNKIYEVVCPKGFTPRPRAGHATNWHHVFTRTSTGDTVWRNLI